MLQKKLAGEALKFETGLRKSDDAPQKQESELNKFGGKVEEPAKVPRKFGHVP